VGDGGATGSVRLRDRWVLVGALFAGVAFAAHLVESLTNRGAFDVIAVLGIVGMVGSVGVAYVINRRAS
jgi:multisubunit Na+/H+ antiporter MnhF subunit